ncbi:hypothetical protein PR202_ga01527 [Eleusine coracana subsp. coracana]|uniref:Uncharacterized protein n=1 Tax=Eleusine coracana subsp. coracana TaxID=191504 RepID=A0AAV5BJC3_ELECO|nr:hypothetical protein PR202_ga00840 [Eleusine coracana subsp. coracana]GJM85733.1 hypothetical protein PR202_ga01527 [Eleusine coracana subsp. coracana]
MGFPVDNVSSVPEYSERIEMMGSPPADNLAIGSTGLPGHGTQIAARKNTVNANHLLNFQYDPIARPQPRGPRTYPPRRQKKIKPYNKDLFLQANYKFVVLDTGLIDDMEKLPYVSAALEQLEERRKYWTEYRSYGSSPTLGDSFSPGSSYSSRNLVDGHASHQNTGHKLSPVSDGDMVNGISLLSISPGSNKSSDKRALSKMGEKTHVNSGHDYTFYQVLDGQHIILHPLNMRCLLDHFGGSDMLPPRISGKILELETVTQSETTRKRYRFLSHFSLTTTFQFCEIDLSDMLPPSSLAPFMDEIKKREKQRIRAAKKEESERVKAEVAAEVQATAMRFEHKNFSYSHNDFMFSLDDFEALGNNAGPSTSPPASERKLFSDVTRLGFASAQDSPPLRIESVDANGQNGSARDQGPSVAPSLSFASIISSSRATASAENNSEMTKPNGVGKKGKKPTRVLMSTGGGRRY